MIQEINVIFDGKSLHLESPLNLDVGTRVKIIVETILPQEIMSIVNRRQDACATRILFDSQFFGSSCGMGILPVFIKNLGIAFEEVLAYGRAIRSW